MDDLRIGGMTPISTTDYPGHLSAVIFCQGCPWQCRYCHNPHLIPIRSKTEITLDGVLCFLEKRIGLLDAVVLSGGEPTMQSAIVNAADKIKSLGFKVALHTGGQHPKILEKLLPYLSWIGMDIKAPFVKYPTIVQRTIVSQSIMKSVNLIIDSGIDHEFRTTIHKNLLSKKDVFEIEKYLNSKGAKKYILQQFRSEGCIDQELCASYTDLSEFEGVFELRG